MSPCPWRSHSQPHRALRRRSPHGPLRSAEATIQRCGVPFPRVTTLSARTAAPAATRHLQGSRRASLASSYHHLCALLTRLMMRLLPHRSARASAVRRGSQQHSAPLFQPNCSSARSAHRRTETTARCTRGSPPPALGGAHGVSALCEGERFENDAVTVSDSGAPVGPKDLQCAANVVRMSPRSAGVTSTCDTRHRGENKRA